MYVYIHMHTHTPTRAHTCIYSTEQGTDKVRRTSSSSASSSQDASSASANNEEFKVESKANKVKETLVDAAEVAPGSDAEKTESPESCVSHEAQTKQTSRSLLLFTTAISKSNLYVRMYLYVCMYV
jgi:hypothetical protein